MNEYLVYLVEKVKDIASDTYNPETYFNNSITGDTGMLKSQYVLGNLYAKGYSEKAQMHFEIFKDHSTWQIWVWPFDSERPDRNQFSVPYYKYDEVIKFLSTL